MNKFKTNFQKQLKQLIMNLNYIDISNYNDRSYLQRTVLQLHGVLLVCIDVAP